MARRHQTQGKHHHARRAGGEGHQNQDGHKGRHNRLRRYGLPALRGFHARRAHPPVAGSDTGERCDKNQRTASELAAHRRPRLLQRRRQESPAEPAGLHGGQGEGLREGGTTVATHGCGHGRQAVRAGREPEEAVPPGHDRQRRPRRRKQQPLLGTRLRHGLHQEGPAHTDGTGEQHQRLFRARRGRLQRGAVDAVGEDGHQNGQLRLPTRRKDGGRLCVGNGKLQLFRQ